MKIIHIADGPPLYTNCFLLVGSEGHAVAIDPAAPIERWEQALLENHATLTHILLTHGHFDHVGSVDALRQKYGAAFYMNDADAKLYNLQPDAVYSDFGTLTVDDMTLTTIFTPGHSPGSTCIRCGGWLFTGDTLFAGDIGRTDFKGGNAGEMQKSLQKLLAAVPDNPQILPGHEEFSTMAEEKHSNPYLHPAP